MRKKQIKKNKVQNYFIEDPNPGYYTDSTKIFDLRKQVEKDDYMIEDKKISNKLDGTYYNFQKQCHPILNRICIKATEFLGLYINDYHQSDDNSTWIKSDIKFILIDSKDKKIKFEETVYRSIPLNLKENEKLEKEKNDNINQFINHFIGINDLLRIQEKRERLFIYQSVIDSVELENYNTIDGSIKRDNAIFLITGEKLIISYTLGKAIERLIKMNNLSIKFIDEKNKLYNF